MTDAAYRPMERSDLPQAICMSRDNMSNIIYTSWGMEWKDEDLLRILLAPGTVNEVLELNGEVVGYFSAEARNGSMFLNSIQIRRGYQGIGLGRAMMARVQALAREQGLPSMELWVQVTNRRAISFYERIGFQVTSRQGGNLMMHLELDPEPAGAPFPAISSSPS